jgi:hypothetical protein
VYQVLRPLTIVVANLLRIKYEDDINLKYEENTVLRIVPTGVISHTLLRPRSRLNRGKIIYFMSSQTNITILPTNNKITYQYLPTMVDIATFTFFI